MAIIRIYEPVLCCGPRPHASRVVRLARVLEACAEAVHETPLMESQLPASVEKRLNVLIVHKARPTFCVSESTVLKSLSRAVWPAIFLLVTGK